MTEATLKFHKICEENRTRLVDWILQVLRAFKLSTHVTFFLAISIIDRYLIEKQKQNVSLGTQALYLLGMAAILLSSKYEDIIPIPADNLVNKAGHNKFSLAELVSLERDVL